MYGVASTTADLSTLFSNTGILISYIVGVILIGLVALLGLGWGIRHLRKYITGRKF